jgi:mitochondrial protein import protein ZIM17
MRLCEAPQSLPMGDTARPQGPDAGNMGFVGPDQLGISFTCGVCDTRITKAIKRKSYETGVVLIQCPGCDKHHVVADNLGYYSAVTDGKKNIEELAADKGERVTRGMRRSLF